MRVLAAGTLYPPHGTGGYELVWQGANAHLRDRGHTVRTLATEHREQGVEAADEPETFRELRWYWQDHAFPRRTLRERVAIERHNRATLDRHLDEWRPDIVAWWPVGGLSLALLEQVRRRGIPAVAFVHDGWPVYGPQVDAFARLWRGRGARLAPLAERVTGCIARLDLAHAARYLYVSEWVRRRVPPAADTGVLHSGIHGRFAAAAAPPAPWAGRLLSVGRLDARKGVRTAVRALADLPGATLTVAGAGDPREARAITATARDAGVGDRVALLGPVDAGRLPALYTAHDAVVFPVEWEEPWGLVPLEAMAVGRPVLATARGGSAEYLRDGENALLHPAGDAAALAAAVARLAGDPALRETLVAGGRATAAKHTAARFEAGVAAELERTAAGSPSGSAQP